MTGGGNGYELVEGRDSREVRNFVGPRRDSYGIVKPRGEAWRKKKRKGVAKGVWSVGKCMSEGRCFRSLPSKDGRG